MSDPLAILSSLEPVERAALELLAAACDTLSASVLGHCLNAQGLRTAEGARFTGRVLLPTLTRLEDRGVVAFVPSERRFSLLEALREPLLRALLADGRFEALAEEIAEHQPLPRRDDDHGWRRVRPGTLRRALRRALDAGQTDEVLALLARWDGLEKHREPRPRLGAWVDAPLDLAMLRRLHPALAGLLLEDLSRLRWERAEAGEPLGPLLEELLAAAPRAPTLRIALARERLLGGELDAIEDLLAGLVEPEALALRGLLALARGDGEASVTLYAKALSARRKRDGRGLGHLHGPAGAFQPLAYLLHPSASRRKQGRKLLRDVPLELSFEGDAPLSGHRHLARLAALVEGEPLPEAKPVIHPTAALLAGLVSWWAGEPLDSGALDAARLHAQALGQAWLAAELDALLVGDPRRAVGGARALVSLLPRSSDWERRLGAVEALVSELGAAGPDQASDQPRARVAWFLDHSPGSITLEARSQKRGAAGWSRGRPLAVKRLKNDPGSVAGATEQDKRVAACARIEVVRHWGRYQREEIAWDQDRCWAALVGHPALFDAGEPAQPIELLQRPPRLLLQREGEALRLALSPPLDPGGAVVVDRVAPERIDLVIFDEAQRRAAQLLGTGLALPAEARGRLASLLDRLAGLFEVHDDSAALRSSARSLPHDPRPVLQLRPAGEGLSVQLRVRPFGAGGPVLRPGQGGELLVARIDGEGVQVLRDHQAELRAAEALEEALPSLAAAAWRGDDRWLDGGEAALELLLEAEALGDALRIEWPEGEPLRLRGELGPDALFMSLRGRGDWFDASAQLRADGGLVLELQQLLALLDGRPRRFVALDDGQYLALTTALQRRLDAIARLGEPGQGEGLRVHRLAVGALDSVLDDLGGLDTDEAWRMQVEAMASPQAGLEELPVPRELRAELRPYQREGFAWLARVAELGAGACLADDMGLGKTVQVLALLLQRAWLGPALVVAPTSVCGGWCEQAWRFAPDLRVHRFGPGDRDALLAGLGPSDLVVCSYGLLQAEQELFTAQRWSTVVLDEAQAIKNPNTQRHRAACALQAEQRVVTTGTPIENHLGDLWALFRFLNPGLLGSWERFRARFGEDIEAGDREVRAQLRRLVLPFVLRRRKAEVLTELPPRSEVQVDVALYREERALYEALRERAEDWLDQLEDPQPLQILAQLTKLRMACCHPSLALEGGRSMASAKLDAFAEIVAQLRDGGHRALVFSGFVKHLAVLRAWLDQRGVPYQYLDGSTPAAQRDRAVAAFQAGQGELFLISLRAGGFGLNLTAADYVIHMDPWWNPAVEDQASDRAHRIGQRRPVTVYRLVAQGTIEEKILALHARKRALAEGILQGSDAAGRMGTQELLALIREQVPRPC
jgi:superfamily II DNA or RNA helicase